MVLDSFCLLTLCSSKFALDVVDGSSSPGQRAVEMFVFSLWPLLLALLSESQFNNPPVLIAYPFSFLLLFAFLMPTSGLLSSNLPEGVFVGTLILFNRGKVSKFLISQRFGAVIFDTNKPTVLSVPSGEERVPIFDLLRNFD